jgi:hypothetical protein
MFQVIATPPLLRVIFKPFCIKTYRPLHLHWHKNIKRHFSVISFSLPNIYKIIDNSYEINNKKGKINLLPYLGKKTQNVELFPAFKAHI